MVIYYTFKGISKPEGLKIGFFNRERIYLASAKTNFKFVDVSDKFYDTAIEKEKCIRMDEKEFDATIIKTFEAQGYGFLKKEDIT
jgi:hypothetical protein